ncbi:asparaginase domain-containing protein [Rhodococcus sp. NPDC060084]|uniref:asparaginase domain-containing protein n=1 Tax=Rhodococcus sp. NPDC060084 TaxID=3347053 RepID=UPI00365E4304
MYVEALSAHPLEVDAAELYGEPDGYLDPATGDLLSEPRGAAKAVYRVALDPGDGAYLLPYAAVQRDRSPWDTSFAATGEMRQQFYPDASRIFEEIDRYGIDEYGHNNLLGSIADYDFVRAAPSGGYTKGLPAEARTDLGEGDIAPEALGEDFFPYKPVRREPALPTLARLTNCVARTLDGAEYDGAIWLEGSPTAEETIYWLNLLIDTRTPIVANSSQYPHGVIGNDGNHNLIQAARYIASRVWEDDSGVDRVGAVMVQNGQIFTSREVQKADARPGGYIATGGHGGIVGNTVWDPVLSFVPVARHTHRSAVRLSELPDTVPGVRAAGWGPAAVDVTIKDGDGYLLPDAMPKVTVSRYTNFGADDFSDTVDGEVEVLARIRANLARYPLAGFVAEGSSPYAGLYESLLAAMKLAVAHGFPVVAVGRGGGGYVSRYGGQGGLFVTGGNLTAPKARMLLMACLLKFGALPPALDPANPTPAELDAVRAKVVLYQQVFDSH